MSIFDTILSSLRSLVGGGSTNESESSPGSTRAGGQVSVEHETERADADASTEATIKGADDAETSTESEDATEPGDTADSETSTEDATAEPVAAETDAAASTETLLDDETGKEPAEAVETAGEGEEAVSPDPDAEDIETPDEAVAADTDAAASTETLVDEATGQEPAEAVTPTEAPEDGSEDEDASAEDDDAASADDEADATAAEAETTADEADTTADDEAAGAETGEGESEPVETLKGIGPAYAERLGTVDIETVADLAAADADDVADDIGVSSKRVSGWVERAREQS